MLSHERLAFNSNCVISINKIINFDNDHEELLFCVNLIEIRSRIDLQIS